MVGMRQPITPSRAPLVGFAGSVAIAVGAWGSGVFPRPDTLQRFALISALRSPVGAVACTVLAAAGMITLVLAWFALRRDLPGHRRLQALTVLWALPLALAPPIMSRDIYGYAAVGDLINNGLNPALHGSADLPSQWLSSTSSSWYHLPFAYGPLFVMATHGIVAASGTHLMLAVFGLRLVAILGWALLVLALPPLARACRIDPRRALWLGALNPLVLTHFVGGGHADSLMTGLLVTAVAMAARGYRLTGRAAWTNVAAGMALCTAAIAVKGTAALALPFLFLLWPVAVRTWRGFLTAAAATAVVVAPIFAMLTAFSGVGYAWITQLDSVGQSVQWTSISTGVGLAAARVAVLAGSPGHTDGLVAAGRLAGEIVAAVILVVLWVKAFRRPDLSTALRAAGWAMITVVILGPAFHGWYLPWGLCVLAGVVATGRERTVLIAASSVCCFLVLPNGYDLARATRTQGAALDVLIAVGAAILGIRWLLQRRRTVQRVDAVQPHRERV